MDYFYRIVIFLFLGCNSFDGLKPELEGDFYNKGIHLNFKDTVLTSYTDNYVIIGQFYTWGDSIKCKTGWKSTEYNIIALCFAETYKLNKDSLTLYSPDSAMVFYRWHYFNKIY
jgi:hypothetical protein